MNKTEKYISERLIKQFDVLRETLTVPASFQMILGTFFLRICYEDQFKNRIETGKKNHWDHLRNTNEPLRGLGYALKSISKSDKRFENILSFFKYDYERNSPKVNNVLNLVVSNINALELAGQINFANIIEEFLSYYFEHQGKGGGESITPLVFKKLVSSLLEKEEYESGYDPCIGVGSFTVLGPEKLKSFTAQEINSSTQALSSIVHFISGHEDFEIRLSDSLREPIVIDGRPKQNDLVVAFPPFNMPLNNSLVQEMQDDRWGRFRYGVSKDSNWAFVQEVLSSMKADGIGIVVLPFGALFSSGLNRSIRKALIDENYIEAVIQLPDKLFYNTSIPVAMVLLRKDRGIGDPIFCIRASDLGKQQGSRRHLDDKEIEKIANAYKNFESIDGFSHPITVHEIMNEDYNLLPSRYIFEDVQMERVVIQDVIEALSESKEVADESYSKLNSMLEGFGINLT